jgi:hypothetical protein
MVEGVDKEAGEVIMAILWVMPRYNLDRTMTIRKKR